MPSPGRLCACGIGAAAAEGLGAAALAATFGWQRVSAVMIVSALATALAVIALHRLLRPSGGDGRNGGTRPPDPDPPWWPDFERELRDYERKREVTRA